ncbi:unnamed protein product [Effrenium voratum]|nr:unnamed protein product [Effrenium voratum]
MFPSFDSMSPGTPDQLLRMGPVPHYVNGLPCAAYPAPVQAIGIQRVPQVRHVAAPPAAAPRRWMGEQTLHKFIQAVQESAGRPNEREKAYVSFLHALAAWGLLEDIPCHAAEVLVMRVSLPFCGALTEVPRLVPFLVNHMKRRCRLHLHACDIDDRPSSYWWPAWKDWIAHFFATDCILDCQQQDLSTETIAPSSFGLVLGIHPLVMGTGCAIPWRKIMKNVPWQLNQRRLLTDLAWTKLRCC